MTLVTDHRDVAEGLTAVWTERGVDQHTMIVGGLYYPTDLSAIRGNAEPVGCAQLAPCGQSPHRSRLADFVCPA